MKRWRIQQQLAGCAYRRVISSWTLARAARLAPKTLAAFVRHGVYRHWRVGLVLVGLVVQLVLTVMMWQLVELSISLMEVWTELARKHLEIVLS